MSTLRFRVHEKDGDVVAAVHDAEFAASIVANLGDGATVRYHNNVVWMEGRDGCAGDSYDECATVMFYAVDDIEFRRMHRAPTRRPRQSGLAHLAGHEPARSG